MNLKSQFALLLVGFDQGVFGLGKIILKENCFPHSLLFALAMELKWKTWVIESYLVEDN